MLSTAPWLCQFNQFRETASNQQSDNLLRQVESLVCMSQLCDFATALQEGTQRIAILLLLRLSARVADLTKEISQKSAHPNLVQDPEHHGRVF